MTGVVGNCVIIVIIMTLPTASPLGAVAHYARKKGHNNPLPREYVLEI